MEFDILTGVTSCARVNRETGTVVNIELVTIMWLAATASSSSPIRWADMLGMGFSAGPNEAWPDEVTHVRLWDNEVAWRNIHLAPDTYDWTRLDALVDKAGDRPASPTPGHGAAGAFAGGGVTGRNGSSPGAVWIAYEIDG